MLCLNKSNQKQNYDIEIKHEDDSRRNAHVSALQVQSEDGDITLHVALLDFTEKKTIEEALSAEKEKHTIELLIAKFQRDEKEKRALELSIINKELSIAATIFESQEGMMVTNANNVILRVNHAFTK